MKTYEGLFILNDDGKEEVSKELVDKLQKSIEHAGGRVDKVQRMGARPFAREQYIGKFTELADGVVDAAERQRFLDAVQHVSGLKGGDLGALNVRVLPEVLDKAPTIPSGIFR